MYAQVLLISALCIEASQEIITRQWRQISESDSPSIVKITISMFGQVGWASPPLKLILEVIALDLI